MSRYNPREAEPKWQAAWAENDSFRALGPQADSGERSEERRVGKEC